MAGFNHFPLIAAIIKPAIGQIVRDTVDDILHTYVTTAPIDTGFMVDSAYTVTSTYSTYGRAGSPPKGAYLQPEVPKPDDETTAYMAVAASYAIYPEFGTRFQPAQPAFYPAVELARIPFEDRLSNIESSLKGRITTGSI